MGSGQFPCPSCSEEFDSEGGMKKHHYYVHGESLVEDDPDNIQCLSCDRWFKSERAVKVHHKKTHGQTLSDHQYTCHQCGEEFVGCKHNDGKYCSMECYGKSERNRVTEYCDYCGEEVTRSASRMRKNHCFCSLECMNGYRREEKDFHPWTGSGTSYRGPSWDEQREKALKRDSFECQECSSGEAEAYRLDVHHITPFKEYGVEDHNEANRLDNLLTLCRTCHIEVEWREREC